MSTPRMRAVGEWGGTSEPQTLHENYNGARGLWIEWPTDAPPPFDKPEAALKEWQLPYGSYVRVLFVKYSKFSDWCGACFSPDLRYWVGFYLLKDLRPVEPPKCEQGGAVYSQAKDHATCPCCGAILSDRRKEQRRSGKEPRGSDCLRGDDRRGHVGAWLRPNRPDRRTNPGRRQGDR